MALVLGTTAALPAYAGPARAADGTSRYAFAEDARRIEGARGTAQAVPLTPGAAYRSSLPGEGEVFYRLELDGTSNAYVSATAVPSPGSTVSSADGLRISVADGDGRSCSLDTVTFGAPGSPRPLTAWGMREISPTRSLCRAAGTYYVSVERAGRAAGGGATEPWDLELAVVSEPGLREAGATSAPTAGDSASPPPPTGEAVHRPGGTGFSRATVLGEGVWRDDIRPGRTLFYKVPVDWGQRLSVTAELSGSGTARRGYLVHALDLALHNPARGVVQDVGVSYDGGQKAGSLAALPPVAYANRYAAARRIKAMRFAGSYYLVAHLARKVADTFGDEPVALTLRVRVSGAGQAGPEYAGEPVPSGVFQVSAQDRAEAAGASASAGGDSVMTAVAVGGIGTGTVLLAGLGVWTVVARRRAGVSP
ncbi:hypothetical protein AB0K80_15565 [Streptomyces sp. NPDC052682]|uniref:hypothetical protein n=1 Tax=Streptomyces sp. NPDC052682 TaxID=3154954 RepID=UPI00343BB96A